MTTTTPSHIPRDREPDRGDGTHVPLDAGSRLPSIGLAVVVTVLWSSSWILIRFGLDDEQLPPLVFAGLRYSTAAVVLAGVTLTRSSTRRELRRLTPSNLRLLVVLGVVYFAVTQGAQFVAIDAQPAATSSLMLAPTAFLVAVFSAPSIQESVSRSQVFGAALVVVGAALYFSGDLGATVVGMTASVVGLLANVGGSLLGRAANRSATITPIVVTTVSMGVGATLLMGAGLAIDGLPELSVRAAVIIGWLAVANTAVAFTLWNRAQRRLAAVESSAINNTMLVQIALLAWIFLGESPGPVGVVGIVVVSIGAFVAQVRRPG